MRNARDAQAQFPGESQTRKLLDRVREAITGNFVTVGCTKR